MGKNEFGVESSSSGGFGAGVGDDFEHMFEEATNASVVDDEISDGRRHATPAPRARVEPEPIIEFDPIEEPELAVAASFDAPDLDSGFDQAEAAEPSDGFGGFAGEDLSGFDDSFDDFGAEPDPEPSNSFSSFLEENEQQASSPIFESLEPSYESPRVEEDESAQTVAEPDPALEPTPVPAATPEAVYAAPVVVETAPAAAVVAPEPVAPQAPAPAPVAQIPAPSEADVDYIERVILTSDAIRELPEDDAKAVNMFITAGQPVESHQELVLTALFADRQILKTADAILEAKSKSSVDRAFHILGLDDETFVDFGKILSHDLEVTEAAIFEGDRLQYARKLVDVVESLPAVSIKRFEAVRSVLGAGELDS